MGEHRKTSIGTCIIEPLGRPKYAVPPTLNLECPECGSKWTAAPRPDWPYCDLQICPNAQCPKAQRDRAAAEAKRGWPLRMEPGAVAEGSHG